MKPLLPITLLLAVTASGQTPCTNCPTSTNNPPAWTNTPLPPGSLQLIPKGTNQLVGTNFAAHHLYQFESSSNLANWSAVSVEFTNAANDERVLTYTNSGTKKFFRLAETTFETATVQPIGIGVIGQCPGNFVAYAIYYGPDWIETNTNTSLHAVYYAGTNQNVRIEYNGNYGDVGCGTNFVTVSGYSPLYRFRLLYPTMPNTNATDTVIYAGLDDD